MTAKAVDVLLRQLEDADEDPLFEMMRNPDAVRMAAFTAEDPSDRPAFARWFVRLRTGPTNRAYAVEADGALAGWAGSFLMDGDREVTYWIDRALWGRGIAKRALALLVAGEPERPLSAHVATGNIASQRVLASAGFVVVGRDTGFAAGVGAEVEELHLMLHAEVEGGTKP